MPDHSTLSKARHGRVREARVFRRVFERVASACTGAGLVGGDGFAIGAPIIETDASCALGVDGPTPPPERADPESATRPVRERLAALDAAAARLAGTADHGTDGEEQPRRLAAAAAPAESPSPTDPAAAGTSKGARKASFAHAVNGLVDLERAIVVDVAASPARLGRRRWPRRPPWSGAPAGDSGSSRPGSPPTPPAARAGSWTRASGRTCPSHRGAQAKGMMTRAEFGCDRGRDVSVCPASHDLGTTGAIIPGGLRRCRARPTSCGPCALKPRCTAGPARVVARNVHEDGREHVRQLAGTPELKRSARGRRRVGKLSARLKRNPGLWRLGLRGPTGAGDGCPLAATARNLRRLARNLATPPLAGAPAPSWMGRRSRIGAPPRPRRRPRAILPIRAPLKASAEAPGAGSVGLLQQGS